MTVDVEQPEVNKMARIRNCTNFSCCVLPLIISISCLVVSGFINVDRGQSGNAPDIFYNDIFQKEYLNASEDLPCADLDEYDTFVVPVLGDNRARQSGNQEVVSPDIENDQKADVKEELESDRDEDEEVKDESSNGKVECSSRENETDDNVGNDPNDEDPTNSAGEEGENEEDPSLSAVSRAANLKKPKLKKIGAHGEKLAKLEKEIARIAEGDAQFRESTHRKQIKTRHSHNHEPETSDSGENERDFTSVYRPVYRPHGRKKRLRVSDKRHHSATDDSKLPTPSKRDAAIEVDDWDYCGDMGPEKWQEKWPDCGGNAQSPINLDTTTAKIDYEPVLKWKGYSNSPSKMTLINNGHSVVLTTSYEDCGNRPFIWDSIISHEYVFGEVTFHWGPDESSGSEHTINYMKYPLEMQVVHYRRELGSIEKAQEVPGGIAIVAILYHLETGNRQNKGISDVQTGFSGVRDGPSSSSIQPFPLSRLIPQFSKHYLLYNGSMTSPPCTETVIWIVHLKQASISKKQLAKFHRLKNEGKEIKHNDRPVQKTNKRCILEIT